MALGDIVADIAGRAVLTVLEVVIDPPVRWLGHLLVRCVLLLARRDHDVSRDGNLVFAVGFVAGIALLLVGFEAWARWSSS